VPGQRGSPKASVSKTRLQKNEFAHRQIGREMGWQLFSHLGGGCGGKGGKYQVWVELRKTNRFFTGKFGPVIGRRFKDRAKKGKTSFSRGGGEPAPTKIGLMDGIHRKGKKMKSQKGRISGER